MRSPLQHPTLQTPTISRLLFQTPTTCLPTTSHSPPQLEQHQSLRYILRPHVNFSNKLLASKCWSYIKNRTPKWDERDPACEGTCVGTLRDLSLASEILLWNVEAMIEARNEGWSEREREREKLAFATLSLLSFAWVSDSVSEWVKHFSSFCEFPLYFVTLTLNFMRVPQHWFLVGWLQPYLQGISARVVFLQPLLAYEWLLEAISSKRKVQWRSFQVSLCRP